MNRIDRLFSEKKRNILSIYFTAGYPAADSTTEIIRSLSQAGADMIEIGVPFSDPVADGQVIQHCSRVALKNGMSLKLLFHQLENIRKVTDIPLVIMSYINPVLRFGIDRFCESCNKTGIDGLILPDLPPEVYHENYRDLFNQGNLNNILMISPRTSPDRIRHLDRLSRGFIYMVSSSSITGIKQGFSEEQEKYFSRIIEMELKNPILTGFGISNYDTFMKACEYANGAIIGSAFVQMLGEKSTGKNAIEDFISRFRVNPTSLLQVSSLHPANDHSEQT